jgi:hypothetical protein
LFILFFLVSPTETRLEVDRFLIAFALIVLFAFCSAADRQRTADKLYLVLENVSALVAAGVDKLVGVLSA